MKGRNKFLLFMDEYLYGKFKKKSINTLLALMLNTR